MRRAFVSSLLTVVFVLALPALRLHAVCEPPPPPDSEDGLREIRATPLIAWGVLEGAPVDAHGTQSFVLRVRGYFRGIGPSKIIVTDYGDGEPAAPTLAAGSSADASQQLVSRLGGQDVVVFGRPDAAPYTGQFATNVCSYTAYGDAEAADILSLLRVEFGGPRPPILPQSGPAHLIQMVAAALALMGAGTALRRGARASS